MSTWISSVPAQSRTLSLSRARIALWRAGGSTGCVRLRGPAFRSWRGSRDRASSSQQYRCGVPDCPKAECGRSHRERQDRLSVAPVQRWAAGSCDGTDPERSTGSDRTCWKNSSLKRRARLTRRVCPGCCLCMDRTTMRHRWTGRQPAARAVLSPGARPEERCGDRGALLEASKVSNYAGAGELPRYPHALWHAQAAGLPWRARVLPSSRLVCSPMQRSISTSRCSCLGFRWMRSPIWTRCQTHACGDLCSGAFWRGQSRAALGHTGSKRHGFAQDGSEAASAPQHRPERTPRTCVAFRQGAVAEWLRTGDCVDVLYRPSLNRWQGRESLQLVVEALRRHGDNGTGPVHGCD